MKKIVLIIIPLMLFSLLSGSIGEESFKFGVVDLQSVLDNYQTYIEAGNVIKAGQEKLNTNLEEIGTQITTLEEKKTKTELFVEQAETSTLEAEIRQKQLEYQQVLNRGRAALLEKEQELLAPIFKELKDLIIKVGKEDNYDLIIDKQAALYFNEKYNITDELIGLVNTATEKKDAENPQPQNGGTK